MASIVKRTTKNGSRRLYVKFANRDGKAFWELQPTALLKEAQARKSQVEALLIEHKGMWPPPEARVLQTVTLADACDSWLERHQANLRPRVAKCYELSLRLHVKPLLGDRVLPEIGPADAKLLRDEMRKQGKSDSTIRAALVPFRSVVRDWSENERIGDPISGVRLFKGGATRIQPPSLEQVEKAIANARPDAQDVLRVAAATGMRRGELFAIRWRDIDTTQNLIAVRASNYGGRIVEQTKTEDGERSVPLFRSIRQLLLERKARQQYSRDGDFVFGNSIGTPMDPGNFARREWLPALKRAGLPHWRFHDLRHFAVSQLIAEGADILLLARIAGHKDPAVTLRVYSHLMNERVSEAADRFDPLRGTVRGVAVDQR